MRRTIDRVITLGRPAIDPDRPHPLGGNHTMSDQNQTADKDGVYMVNGSPLRFKKGDVMPAGAEYRDGGATRDASVVEQETAAIKDADAEKADTRARKAAPENRSK